MVNGKEVKLKEKESSDLGNGFKVKIGAINKDKCDYAVCDLHYDVYDEVEVEVLR